MPRPVPFGYLGFAILSIGIIAACEQSDQKSADEMMTAGDAAMDAPPFVCSVEAPTVCPEPPPRWSDVNPIFQQRCVGCHYGMPGGPWPLLQYQHVADWYDVVRAHVLECTMPPVEFLSAYPMTTDERIAILTWILCGIPE